MPVGALVVAGRCMINAGHRIGRRRSFAWSTTVVALVVAPVDRDRRMVIAVVVAGRLHGPPPSSHWSSHQWTAIVAWSSQWSSPVIAMVVAGRRLICCRCYNDLRELDYCNIFISWRYSIEIHYIITRTI